MLLKVNFVYNANVRHRRKVNAVEKPFVGTVPVDVPEASSDEAPVAMRFKAPLGYDPAPGFTLELRRHADALYVPLYLEAPNRFELDPAMHKPQGAGWLAEVAEGAYRRNGHTTLPLDVGISYDRYPAPIRIEDEPMLRDVQSSDEAAVAGKIAAQAADLLVVDGVLHTRCREPVYGVSHFEGNRRTGAGGYSYLSPVFGRFDETRRAADREFRADEVGYVREHRSHVRLSDEDTIEVVDPDMVRADIPQRRLLASAVRIRDWMGERVANRDVPFFKAYYDLRELLEAEAPAIAAGDCTRTGEKADAAHESLGRIADMAEQTLRQVAEFADDIRNEFETHRLRVEALGVWSGLDAAAIPAR